MDNLFLLLSSFLLFAFVIKEINENYWRRKEVKFYIGLLFVTGCFLFSYIPFKVWDAIGRTEGSFTFSLIGFISFLSVLLAVYIHKVFPERK